MSTDRTITLEPEQQQPTPEARIVALAPIASTPLTPMAMLSHAVAHGANMDVLTRLMDLQERHERNLALKAFDAAMASTKGEIPVIRKNRYVGYESRRTRERTDYRHEDMAEIARTVDPILAKFGLSYRYRTASEPSGVTVTCIISHRDGHSEETTLSAGTDTSGLKNSIQAIGSTITYLQRYTLKAALGLSAASDDDDAKTAGDANGGFIIDAQVEQLESLMRESGANKDVFLKWLRVDTLDEIPQCRFDEAVQKLNAKRAHKTRD